jgi:hypothetical protein
MTTIITISRPLSFVAPRRCFLCGQDDEPGNLTLAEGTWGGESRTLFVHERCFHAAEREGGAS